MTHQTVQLTLTTFPKTANKQLMFSPIHTVEAADPRCVNIETNTFISLKNLTSTGLHPNRILFDFRTNNTEKEIVFNALTAKAPLSVTPELQHAITGMLLIDELTKTHLTLLSNGVCIGELPSITFVENYLNISMGELLY